MSLPDLEASPDVILWSALSNCRFLMDVLRLSWVSFPILGKEKSHMGQSGEYECVWMLVFVSQLKINGFLGTILAHTFFMFKIVKFLIISLFVFNSSAITMMPNDHLFSQESLLFPHFYQFSLLPDGQVIHHLPYLFLLKTSCAVHTQKLLIRCSLHTLYINWTLQGQVSSVS